MTKDRVEGQEVDTDLNDLSSDEGPVDADDSKVGAFDRFFEITKRGSNLGTEILAGFTTFLSMVYILTVNPGILTLTDPGGFEHLWPSVFIATCLSSFISTLIMALLGRNPLAMAPGMGLNAQIMLMYFLPTLGIGEPYSVSNALAIGFLYALVVLVVVVIPIGCNADGSLIWLRDKLYDGVPDCIRKSLGVGIGLFIALVGFEDSNIVRNSEATLVQLVDFSALFTSGPDDSGERAAAKAAIICCITLVVIALLSYLRVPGAVLIAILVGTILGIPMHVTDLDIIAGKADISWAFWKSFKNYFKTKTDQGGAFFACFRGFNFPKGSGGNIVGLIISLGLVDLFDTLGTVAACGVRAGLIDEDGKPLRYGWSMVADSIGSLVAFLLGSSSCTTYVESGTGIAVGGRTGVVSLVVSILFLLSVLLGPIFAFIPMAAASAALIYVGVLMMKTVVDVSFENVSDGIPAFLCVICMPFCYSITDGIGMGMVSYVVIHAVVWVAEFCKWLIKGREGDCPAWDVKIVTLVIFALFVVYFFVPF